MPAVNPLTLGIERLLMGALQQLDLNGDPAAQWLATQLQNLYAADPTLASVVRVRVVAPDKIEIERSGGMPRMLVVGPGGKHWELAATTNAATPGQIAPILANP